MGDDIALVPDMIPGGNCVDPGVIKLAALLRRNTEAMRCVLAICDNEIER
jgi:hypothetical protein